MNEAKFKSFLQSKLYWNDVKHNTKKKKIVIWIFWILKIQIAILTIVFWGL